MTEIVSPEWNKEQLSVITAEPFKRMIVDGGPGTGKTAVLTARIAQLIDTYAITASSIWVISFTRTAVAELRARLSAYLNNNEDAFGIRVATIDSHAWSVNSGFNSDLQITGTFESNIRHVIELIKSNQGVFEYIQNVSHLFIDEAQDVVGLRQELMLELIDAIPTNAGVTIFSDDAQSIYGFSEKGQSSNLQGTLPRNVAKYLASFVRMELKTIHRSESAVLCDFYRSAREVLKSDRKPQEVLSNVRNLARLSRNERAPQINELPEFVERLSGKTFILFRTRGEALNAASVFFSKRFPCRLRLSGLPHVIYPWIASVFWDWTLPEQNIDEFLRRWKERVDASSEAEASYWWNLLVNHFGKTHSTIDTGYMRMRLSSLSPPTEFCSAEFGNEGPIIGTVHTSKGRECENVIFYLPKAAVYRASQAEECLEEARTVFVGVTRARQRLFVGDAESSPGRASAKSGRAFKEVGLRLTSIKIEVGRTKDISAEGLVGSENFPLQQDAINAQALLAKTFSRSVCADVRAKRFGTENKFAISDDAHKTTFLFLSNDFIYDLRSVVRELKLRTHGWKVDQLQIIGNRTIVLNNEDARLSKLHHPWSESGVITAPLLIGFPEITVGYR